MNLPFNICLNITVLFLALYGITVAIPNYDTVTCATVNSMDELNMPNYTVKRDSLLFFQSPGFPKTMYNASNYQCKATFYSETNQSIWFAMIFGNTKIHLSDNYITGCYFDECLINYKSNFDIFTYASTSNMLKFAAAEENDPHIWDAFQAVLVPFDPSISNNSCPLSDQEFDFSNNSELVIPIASSFYFPSDNNNEIQNCSWKFLIDSSQLLKVVIKNFEKPDNSSFLFFLYDDQTVVANFTDDINDEVFYFNGTSFNLAFLNENSNMNFFILVSAVQKSADYTNAGCSVTTGTSGTSFTNADYIHGYPAYQHCESDITIPENHEAFLRVSAYNLESCCDTLSLNYGNNESIPLKNDKPESIFYSLTQKINGGKLDFYSDGNTEGTGYSAVLEIFECVCAENRLFAYCDGSGDSIYPLNDDSNYCSDMSCSFDVVLEDGCPERYIQIQLMTALADGDELNLHFNETDVKIESDGLSYMYYPSGSNLTLSLSSGISSSPISNGTKQFWGAVESVPAPKFKRIDLNQTNSKHFLWLDDMEEDDALTVCTSTGILEIFVSNEWYEGLGDDEDYFYLKWYRLFEGTNLTSFVGTLDTGSEALKSLSPTRPRHRRSETGCFTLYAFQKTGVLHSVLFKVFDENDCHYPIYQIPPHYNSTMTTFNVQIQSNSSKSCEYIFFAGISGGTYKTNLPLIWINNITTDSNATFRSTANNEFLFEVKNADQEQWQKIGIYTPALSVTIPPLSNLSISFPQAFPEKIHYFDGNSEIKGILASPSYSSKSIKNFNSSNLYNFYFENVVTVEMNYLKLNGSNFPVLETAGINKTLSTQSISFVTNQFSIYYSEIDAKNGAFLIEYNIQKYLTFVTTTITTPSTNTSISLTSFTASQPSSTTKNILSQTTPNILSSTSETTVTPTISSNTSNNTPMSKIMLLLLMIIILILN